MKVNVARLSGFCFGVKNAVSTAEKIVSERKDKKLYMLGELTHNEQVVSNLLSNGFTLINAPEEAEEGSLVLLRAHGVTCEVRSVLEKKHCEIIDCTCPFVEKIHKIVRENASKGKNILVAGTKGHPEVIGICSEAPADKVYVISDAEELKSVPFLLSNAILVSQTTFSVRKFQEICANVKNQIAKSCIFDTICCTTESRQNEARKMSEKSDVMLVIGSAKSSNTCKLLDVCRRTCDRTYLVSTIEEAKKLLDDGLVNSSDRVGITAGASTPECIILEVVHEYERERNDKSGTD